MAETGIRSREVSDSLIRRQLDLERLKSGLQGKYSWVTDDLYKVLVSELAELDVSNFGDVTRKQLRLVIKNVLAKLDVDFPVYQTSFLNTLEKYVTKETTYFTSTLNSATDEGREPEPSSAWALFLASIIGATGATPKQSMSDLRTSQKRNLKKFLMQAFTRRWTPTQLLNGFKGTKTKKYKDGLAIKLGRAVQNTVATLVQAGASIARLSVVKMFADKLLGYTWVSILDGKTSKICRTLSGKTFEYGAGPVPPMHYNCRSHIEPIFKKGVISAAASIPVNAGETFYQWLKRQNADIQDSILGSSWAKIFREKGLSAEEFSSKAVNKRLQPITLEELKDTYPDLFK